MFKNLKAAILTLSIFASANGYAGGLILYELGTPDVGLASAGWAARADDAGTVFTNPAGMTRFDRPQLLVGGEPIYLNIKFDPNSKTTVRGSHGNASAWLPAGGGYFVLPLNDRISVGAASVGYFGSALDYGHHWVGRYYLTRTACQGFSFIPGAAYKVTDCLSIGACANIMYAINRSHCQVNNTLDGIGDGRLRAIGNNWAAGAIVGALYEPDPCTRFGITYVSEVKQKFKIKPKFLGIGPLLTEALDTTGISNSRLKILCNVPNWVMASGYRKICPSLAIMGNVGWQEWSHFSRAEISLDNANATTISVTPKYKDTWHIAAGVEYFWECSKATLGMAYDSSMVSNKNRTPSLPVGQQWRFGAGYQFSYSACIKIAAAYELNWTGDLKMYQDRGPLAGTVSGKFKNVYGQFFNLSLLWDF